jgi:hypothetical protein
MSLAHTYGVNRSEVRLLDRQNDYLLETDNIELAYTCMVIY